MTAPDVKLPEPCPPGEDVFQPHEHTRMDDGRPKPCNGRFFCVRCRRWHSQSPCSLPGAVKLPAGWIGGAR